MNLYEITFSPTGGTQRGAERLTAAIGAASLPIDLCARPESWEPPVLMAEDICVVSVPSYGGRVPASAADRIRRISGHSAMAIAVVVYGNRAYDDTLLELKDLLVDQGFR